MLHHLNTAKERHKELDEDMKQEMKELQEASTRVVREERRLHLRTFVALHATTPG